MVALALGTQQRVCDESLTVRRPASQPQFTRPQNNTGERRHCGQHSWVLPKRVGHHATHQVHRTGSERGAEIELPLNPARRNDAQPPWSVPVGLDWQHSDTCKRFAEKARTALPRRNILIEVSITFRITMPNGGVGRTER